MHMLNPNACSFVPCSSSSSYLEHPFPNYVAFYAEPTADFLTPEELEELEAVDDWVDLTAHLEGLEQDHLIAMALKLAPRQKLNEIEKRTSMRQRGDGRSYMPAVSRRPYASARQSRVRTKALFQPIKST